MRGWLVAPQVTGWKALLLFLTVVYSFFCTVSRDMHVQRAL